MANRPPSGKYRKLRTAIIATTLCFAIIPLLVVGLVIPAQFTHLYNEKIVREVESMAQSKGRTIDIFLGERAVQLRTLADLLGFEELTQPERLARILRTVKINAQSYVDLGVVDMQGRHVAYAGAHDVQNVNYQNEFWFSEVKRKGVFISDVFLGFRNFPHIIIAIMREEAGHAWILRATIDSAVLTDLVQASRLSVGGDAFVINKKGYLQTESFFAGHVMEQVKINWPTQKTEISEEQLNGKTMLLAKVPLDNAPWMLVVTEDPTEHLSLLSRARAVAYGVVFLALAALSVGAWLATRFMIRGLIAADKEKAAYDASFLHSRKMAALGKLAGGMAIEINNPLMLIREYAIWIRDLLEDEQAEQIRHYDEIQNAALKVEQNVDRAKDITQRLLGFARRNNPSSESLPLNPIVNQTIALVRNEATARQIAIECTFADGDPRVSTDVGQLQQVLLNILDNAIDAAEKGGQGVFVVTRIDEGAGKAMIVVRDNGPGIPNEQLEHIFEPFFTTKDSSKNTGLGLPICYSIMENLGGGIRARNHPESGAEFIVFLPLNDPSGTRQAEILPIEF